jgi:hypothetical protein
MTKQITNFEVKGPEGTQNLPPTTSPDPNPTETNSPKTNAKES